MYTLKFLKQCLRLWGRCCLQGVGVVTGGIGEMFVSQMVEKIVAPRAGFAKIAIQVPKLCTRAAGGRKTQYMYPRKRK